MKIQAGGTFSSTRQSLMIMSNVHTNTFDQKSNITINVSKFKNINILYNFHIEEKTTIRGLTKKSMFSEGLKSFSYIFLISSSFFPIVMTFYKSQIFV